MYPQLAYYYEHREYKLKYQKEYYRKNKDIISKYYREYYLKKKDHETPKKNRQKYHKINKHSEKPDLSNHSLVVSFN